MTIQGGIGTNLLAYTGLTDVVEEKVYPVRAPDNLEPPYVTYGCSELPEENTLEGTHPRVSLSLMTEAVSSDYDQAWEIARLIRTRLTGHNGTLGDVEDVQIYFEGSSDADAPDVGLFTVESRFQVSYPA